MATTQRSVSSTRFRARFIFCSRTLFLAALIASWGVVSTACPTPFDNRCPPVTSTPDNPDAGPDITLCCEVLKECCDQLPEGNGDPNTDEKILCNNRVNEGALLTCRAELQVFIAARKCVTTQ